MDSRGIGSIDPRRGVQVQVGLSQVLIMQKGRITAALVPAALNDPALVSEYMGL